MPGKVVTPEEYKTARADLLAREKELTRAMDKLRAARASLPMTKVTTPYAFTGPGDKKLSLADLFQGRKQLIIYHFMFDPAWTAGCGSCSFLADEMPTRQEHLNALHTTLAMVSVAPVAQLDAFKARMGWTMDWYSSEGSAFNRDFEATKEGGEAPGMSVFYMGGEGEGEEKGAVYHSYSTYRRGVDQLSMTVCLLDLTPLGRQDDRYRKGEPMRLRDEYTEEELGGRT